MMFDEPDARRDFLECGCWSQGRSPISGPTSAHAGEAAAEPVQLVVLFLIGPREGENDALEFASVEDAVAYGRQLSADPEFQLESIEDANGNSVVGYDLLNDLCCAPPTGRGRDE